MYYICVCVYVLVATFWRGDFVVDGILSGTMSFVRLWEGNFRFERELRMVEENGILGSFCHIVYKNCIQ